jgi:voltage-gated potassium channel
MKSNSQLKTPSRHLALLITILLLFAISPFVVTLHHGVLVLNVIAAAVMVSGSYALGERKHLFTVAIVLSIISILASWLLLVFPGHWTVLVSHSTIALLVAFFSVTILGYVLRNGRVTSDRIFAAICVYMLIGYGWTFLYALLEELQPGSFAATPQISLSDTSRA